MVAKPRIKSSSNLANNQSNYHNQQQSNRTNRPSKAIKGIMSGASNNISQQQQPMAVIKRSQHNIKLANELNNMLSCGSLVDVTIYCDDGQVNAHKLVLAASSTYFRNLFSRMTNAFHYPIIVLREIPVNDLKTIIQFIYHGEVNVSQNRVDSLMRCANYLQIEGVASSANSLNAILASSSVTSVSHHALITAHSGQVSANATNNTATGSSNSSISNKIHPQYHPPTTATTNCKSSSRGHGSRSTNMSVNHHVNDQATNSILNQTIPAETNRNHKPKLHNCPLCLKTFTHGFTLKRHMKLHSQSRLTIYCEVCSKSYSCKDSFLRHKKSSGHLQHAGYNHRSTLDVNNLG